MKKILKIAGGIFLFIIVLSVIIGPSNEPSEEKEVETNKAKQEEATEKQETVIEEVENEDEAETQINQDMFTKEDALQRIQSHNSHPVQCVSYLRPISLLYVSVEGFYPYLTSTL